MPGLTGSGGRMAADGEFIGIGVLVSIGIDPAGRGPEIAGDRQREGGGPGFTIRVADLGGRVPSSRSAETLDKQAGFGLGEGSCHLLPDETS